MELAKNIKQLLFEGTVIPAQTQSIIDKCHSISGKSYVTSAAI
jgi:hypothetical protein